MWSGQSVRVYSVLWLNVRIFPATIDWTLWRDGPPCPVKMPNVPMKRTIWNGRPLRRAS